jgi:uncharacterized protein (TIGR02453 family)
MPARLGAEATRPKARAAQSRRRTIADAFRGFDRDAMQFWHELASEMSREWFAANKQRYQSLWVDPMLALLRDLTRGLSPAYKPFALAEPGVLRIYRDLRFSRDKAPYKTHIAAVLRLAGDPVAEAGNAALYFQVGLDEEYAGVGCYRFDAARIARWREAVVGAPGRALLQIIAGLRGAGYAAGGYEHYARPPKGFAPDHPRVELLKYKGLVCRFPAIPVGLLHQPELARWLLAHGKATAPLVIWLRRHLG